MDFSASNQVRIKVPIRFSALILCQWVGDSSYVGMIYAVECLSLVFVFNSMFNAHSPLCIHY